LAIGGDTLNGRDQDSLHAGATVGLTQRTLVDVDEMDYVCTLDRAIGMERSQAYVRHHLW